MNPPKRRHVVALELHPSSMDIPATGATIIASSVIASTLDPDGGCSVI